MEGIELITDVLPVFIWNVIWKKIYSLTLSHSLFEDTRSKLEKPSLKTTMSLVKTCENTSNVNIIIFTITFNLRALSSKFFSCPCDRVTKIQQGSHKSFSFGLKKRQHFRSILACYNYRYQ